MADPDTAPSSFAATDLQRLRLAQVSRSERRQLLGLLLTGQTRGGESAADQFMAQASGDVWNSDELWAAWYDSEPMAAGLVVPCVGRTAVFFISPATYAAFSEVAGTLIRHMAAQQAASQFSMLQCLLEPHRAMEIQAFVAGGFTPLANLSYMERNALALLEGEHTHPAAPTVESAIAGDPKLQGISLIRYTQRAHAQFTQAVERSYEATLDCPGLLGVRPMEDVIAGHKAVGDFDPALWWCLLLHGEPHGVMLLNPHPLRSCLELVYLGLGKALRGVGLGRLLLDHGIFAARKRGLDLIQLAVDELNAPALKLYRSRGFRQQSRRLALIRPLNRATAAQPTSSTC